MSTKVVLEIETGLAPEEAEFVQQLLRDAIGEFITARSGRGSDRRTDYTPDPNDATIEYVRKRYPDLSIEAHLRKVDEVRLRKAIARKLRRAVDDVRVVEDVPAELIEAVFREGVRAGESVATQRDGTRGEREQSPYPADSLQHHWWTRGFSYTARLLRAIEAEMALEKVAAPITPVAERTCEVLPTVFAESVEDEAQRLSEDFERFSKK